MSVLMAALGIIALLLSGCTGAYQGALGQRSPAALEPASPAVPKCAVASIEAYDMAGAALAYARIEAIDAAERHRFSTLDSMGRGTIELCTDVVPQWVAVTYDGERMELPRCRVYSTERPWRVVCTAPIPRRSGGNGWQEPDGVYAMAIGGGR